jgi:hypothetical protein
MVSISLWSVLFGLSDARIVLLFVAPAYDVEICFLFFFHEDGCN